MAPCPRLYLSTRLDLSARKVTRIGCKVLIWRRETDCCRFPWHTTHTLHPYCEQGLIEGLHGERAANRPFPAAVCVGGGVQTELSMTHGLVRCLPAIQHNGLCTQWPRCLSCWNAKHASNGFRCCVLCYLAKVRPPPTGLRRRANFPPSSSRIVKTARRGQVFILEPGLFFRFCDDFFTSVKSW